MAFIVIAALCSTMNFSFLDSFQMFVKLLFNSVSLKYIGIMTLISIHDLSIELTKCLRPQYLLYLGLQQAPLFICSGYCGLYLTAKTRSIQHGGWTWPTRIVV